MPVKGRVFKVFSPLLVHVFTNNDEYLKLIFILRKATPRCMINLKLLLTGLRIESMKASRAKKTAKNILIKTCFLKSGKQNRVGLDCTICEDSCLI